MGFRGKEGQSTQWNQRKRKIKDKQNPKEKETFKVKVEIISFISFIHFSQTQKNKKTKSYLIHSFLQIFFLIYLFGYQPSNP